MSAVEQGDSVIYIYIYIYIYTHTHTYIYTHTHFFQNSFPLWFNVGPPHKSSKNKWNWKQIQSKHSSDLLLSRPFSFLKLSSFPFCNTMLILQPHLLTFWVGAPPPWASPIFPAPIPASMPVTALVLYTLTVSESPSPGHTSTLSSRPLYPTAYLKSPINVTFFL